MGVRLSQETLLVTDQYKIPPLEFHISRVWSEGFVPSLALKQKLDGL